MEPGVVGWGWSRNQPLPGWNISGGCWARSGAGGRLAGAPGWARGPGLRANSGTCEDPLWSPGAGACLGAGCRDRLPDVHGRDGPRPGSCHHSGGWEASGSGLSSRRCSVPAAATGALGRPGQPRTAGGSACFEPNLAFFLPQIEAFRSA